jgi:hypothetical protein
MEEIANCSYGFWNGKDYIECYRRWQEKTRRRLRPVQKMCASAANAAWRERVGTN